MAKVTNASEFYDNSTKVVVLPSGKLTVRLRKINAREALKEGDVQMLMSVRDIKGVRSSAENMSKEEKEKAAIERWNSMSKEDREKAVQVSDALILAAVMEPPISRVVEEGKICINHIEDDDYNALVKEVAEFSLPKKSELRKFPDDQKSDAAPA